MLVVIILIQGEPLTWYWLLAIPALLLQTMLQRRASACSWRGSGSTVNDFSQLLPFLLRTWMYVSGVLFSVLTLSQSAFGKAPPSSSAILQVNPAAIYITLMRNSLLLSQRLSAPGQQAGERAHLRQVAGAPRRRAAATTPARTAIAVINPDHLWYYAIGWAVVALIIGFFFFWRAEAKYGRG